jgi:Do/DeqQ family serine protease
MKRIFISLLAILLTWGMPARAENVAVPDNAAQVKLSFAPLVKKVAPAVVNIYTKRIVATQAGNPFLNDPFFAPFFNPQMGGPSRQQVERSLGSGLIIQSSGLVVTNNHVIKDAAEIMVVISDGREFAAKVLVADTPSDIALLQLDTKGAVLPFAALESTEGLEVGDLVIAIGNPFGVGQTVTSGIVSAMGRSSLAINQYNYFIQTDAAINPGNSGGPLVAMDGGVVGINSAIYSRDGGSLGIGFAIPSEMVKSVIAANQSGQATGTGNVVRNWLGVSTQDLTADMASSLGLANPQGTIIRTLHDKSPLKMAGVQVGDVITAFNNHPIKDSSELRFRTATLPVGSQMVFSGIRKGKPISFDVKATAAPEDPPRDTTKVTGTSPLAGATLMNINPAVAANLSLDPAATGVIVAAIDPAGVASRFLSSGDIILEVNGRTVEKVKDAVDAAGRVTRRGFVISYIRDGQTRTLMIR